MTIAHVFAEMEALSAAGVVENYALGGAVAAIRYLEPSATQDVDIFVAFRSNVSSPLTPLAPVYEWLVNRGATPEGAHLIIGGWPVQFLPASGPLLEEAMSDAQVADVDGQSVRIFTAEHLAAIALQTGRTKDKLRVAQFVEWSGFDRPRFTAIVERHGLLAKWRQLQRVLADEA